MRAINPEYTAEVWSAALTPLDGPGARERNLWRAVILGAIRDLLRLEDSAKALKAFKWLFIDSEDLSLVCEFAELQPHYFRPRLSALLAVNLWQAAQGLPFLVKTGQGIAVRDKPKSKQQLVARYLLQRDEVKPVLAKARRLPESAPELLARMHREIKAMGLQRGESE